MHRASPWIASLLLFFFGGACHRDKKPKNVEISPISSQSDSPGVRRAMARALLSQGNYQESVRMLRQALKEEGGVGHPETHMLLGVSLRELRFFPEAEAELQLAIKLDSKSAEAWNSLGVLRQMSGQGDAIQAFREACRLAPDEADYHNNLGFSLYLVGKFQEASEELRHAVTIAPDVQRFRNNLGFALGAVGQYDDAKAAFLATGSEAQANNNLGVVYEKKGDLERATAAYQTAVSIDPALNEAKRNLDRIKKQEPLPTEKQ
jgi:Flp pilus assembly protein TadD